MKYVVTFKICGLPFRATVSTIAEAYEHIEAIVSNNTISFPNMNETLSEIIVILGEIKVGEKNKLRKPHFRS